MANNRIDALDVVRGMALFGVLMVNLTTEFRVSIFQQFLGAASAGSGLDSLLERVVSVGLESKAFALFSLLFGVGLAIRFEQLTVRGRPYYWLVRRLLVLLGFGLLHMLLLWNGDILTEYALAGLLALPFLRLRPDNIAMAAFGFLLFYVGQSWTPWTIQWPGAETLRQHVALAGDVYSSGSYVDIVRFAWRELPLLLPLHLYVLPRTLALFLFGMFFWRTGVFKDAVRFKRAIRIAAVGGIAGATAILSSGGIGEWSLNVASTMLGIGYGAAILAVMALPAARKILRLFAPLGRMAFTNYLMQSLVCGWIFFGYGLGHFGRMAVAPAFALGVAIYIAQMILSWYWLGRYRYGPMEWLWRSLMYGEKQPMSKLRSAAYVC